MIKVGDKVRLKIGGPLMVAGVLTSDTATCYWTTSQGNLKTGDFARAALVSDDPSRLTDYEIMTENYLRTHAVSGGG